MHLDFAVTDYDHTKQHSAVNHNRQFHQLVVLWTGFFVASGSASNQKT